MTLEEMKSRVTARTGETDDGELTSSLDAAAQEIINYVYPFDPEVTEVPARYQTKQVDIAIYILNKRGAQGETKHDENGINRSYENADIPKSYFRGIMPFGKAPGV